MDTLPAVFGLLVGFSVWSAFAARRGKRKVAKDLIATFLEERESLARGALELDLTKRELRLAKAILDGNDAIGRVLRARRVDITELRIGDRFR